MRFAPLLAAASLAVAACPAFAQGPAAAPASGQAVDDAYRGRCEAKASKELCACVISVAATEIGDPSDRQIFFDFMMGEVEKAKAARAAYDPPRNSRLNAALQRADVRLGERCDSLRPKPAEQPAPK